MAATIIRNQKCYFGTVDLSPQISSFSVLAGREMLDATALGDATRINVAGLREVSAEVAGFYDAAAVDGLLAPGGTGSQVQLSFLPVSETAGDAAYTFLAETASYEFGGATGDLVEFSAGGVAAGQLMRGYFAYRGAVPDGGVSDVTSATINLGAVGSDEALFVVVHDLDASTGASAIAVAIEAGATAAMSGGGEPVDYAANEVGPLSQIHYRAVVSGVGGASGDVAVIIGKRKV